MSAITQQLAQDAIAAFTAFINGINAEHEARLSCPDWVGEYGESMSKKQAYTLLNRSATFMDKLIADGKVKVNHEKRVLTRSLQAYAEKSPDHKRHMRNIKKKKEVR